MSDLAIILFAHGSRDPHWRRPFETLAAELAAELPPTPVRLAFMEFASPTLLDVAAELVAAGVRRVRLVPLFLAGGAHVARDIPEQVAAVRSRHAGLAVEVCPPVGEDPRLGETLKAIVRDAAGASRPRRRG